MKLLPIHGGLLTQLDDEDFESLSKFKWYLLRTKDGGIYVSRNKIFEDGSRGRQFLHREIKKAIKGQIIDHKDRDTLNNQKANLRFCTHSESMRNKGKKTQGTSHYKGVSFDSHHKRWVSRLKLNGKIVHNKKCKTEMEAALLYNEAAIKYHGEFAAPNSL